MKFTFSFTIDLKMLERILWLSSIFLLIAASVVFFFGNDKELVNFLMQLIPLCAIIAIAIRTFTLMTQSTNETRSSLESVAEKLQILVEDIQKRKLALPDLNIFFTDDSTLIELGSGKECEVEIGVYNYGASATNAEFMLLFPPDIEIVDKGVFQSTPQTKSSGHENYIGLSLGVKNMSYSHYLHTIKIKTERKIVGERFLPYYISCGNAETKKGSLTIKFIG